MKEEPIFTDTFTVESYLEDFFLKQGGRINLARHNHCVDIFANSLQLCMNETIVDAPEQLINVRRDNILEEREENEDRR